MPPSALTLPRERIAEFCSQHHIRQLSLFGSALRDDFGPDSDVDVLVEFEPGRRVGLIRLAGLERELGAILNRKVDLRTPGDLSPYFRDEVLRTAQVHYAAHTTELSADDADVRRFGTGPPIPDMEPQMNADERR